MLQRNKLFLIVLRQKQKELDEVLASRADFSAYLLVTLGKSITSLCFPPTECKATETIFMTVFWKNNYNVCNLVILFCQNRKFLHKTEVIISLVNCCCVCVYVLVTKLCPILCDAMDCSPPGSSVHVILQARILEWVAIPFSKGSSLTQGLKPGLPHCRNIPYHLSHQGSSELLLHRNPILQLGIHCLLLKEYRVQCKDGEGNGTPLQYSYLGNPMDGGAWWAAIREVAKRHDWATSLSLFTFLHWRRK